MKLSHNTKRVLLRNVLPLLVVGAIATSVYAALTGSVNIAVQMTQTSALDLGTVTFPVQFSSSIPLASGTAANQADLFWTDERTLTASATENLDLAGVLTDATGATLTFADVVAFMLCAQSTNTNNVLIGGAASATFKLSMSDNSDIQVVRPGGCFLTVAPDATAYPVTATTGDILKIANSAGSTSVVYKVAIVGRSA